MKFLKILGVLCLLFLLACSVVYIMGARLPVEHAAIVAATIEAPPSQVWALISDTADEASWRKELKGVESAPDQNGQPCFREVQPMMKMTLCVVKSEPQSLRVVRIADKALPFGGTWTYSLQPTADGATQLIITEDGFVYPPVWRFVSHYVMGETGSMQMYVKDLQGAVKKP